MLAVVVLVVDFRRVGVVLESVDWRGTLTATAVYQLGIFVRAVIPMLTLGFLGFDYLRAVRKERNNRAVALGLGFSVLGGIALI